MIRAAFLLALSLTPAAAQSVPENMNPQGVFSGINARNAGWQSKADVGVVTPIIYTAATLPPCTEANAGTLAMATDATSPTYNGTYVGHGTVTVPIQCDGHHWTTH